ncbi:MAG: TonB-dependent receptor, partial [Gammaproteobacteria bacterium]|nr:TonB-dependent receptor [Gammaproteobacteria bacterium]
MKERNPLRDAVQIALSASVAATVTAPVALAADDDVAEQDTVTVTGSRIKRVDIETPLPVTTISREDIDSSGEISVAEVLRGSTFNSFGSFRQSSGSSAQSQSTVSLRGLGATRTLVLLDGRRIAGSPTFGSGSAQNLNTIPLAAVERIEVLRDGASAVYGSDAIGGVVNVILRKDYEGVNLAAGIGRPTSEGGDEENFSITAGVSSGKGNITFSLDHAAQDIIFNADRDFSDVGLSSFGFPGTMWIDGVGRVSDPRCPSGIDTDGDGVGDEPDPNAGTDANGVDLGSSVLRDTRCRYNYAGVSANEASIERDSFFVNSNYEINDSVSFFARGIVSRTESFGRYAPTPVVGGNPFAPTMSADNPNNPTRPGALLLADFPGFDQGQFGVFPAGATDFSQWDTDGDGAADIDCGANPDGACEITSIWYRNVPGGFRDSLVENVMIDGLVGLQGSNDWFGGSDWEVGLQHSSQTNADTTRGLVITPILQESIDSGAFDIFAVNGPTDPNVAQQSIHEGFHNEETRIIAADGAISFDVAQMANGSVPIAVGFDYRDEKFSQDYDGLQNAGAVTGSAGGEDITGARAAYAVYGEVAIPVLDNLEVDLKIRRDHYNDFGNATTPQLSI